jgi:hypothetical protein
MVFFCRLFSCSCLGVYKDFFIIFKYVAIYRGNVMCDSIACNNLPIYLQNVTLDYDRVITPYYTTVGLIPSN